MLLRIDRASRTGGFTLLEMLVSLAVLAVILLALSGVVEMTRRAYRSTMGKIDSFESARAAFDHLSRALASATLMSHLGYDDPKFPGAYERKSDLHFFSAPQKSLGLHGTGAESTHAVFFQATLGSPGGQALADTGALLLATGFFIAYGNDPLLPHPLENKVENRRRYRLFQYLPPKEDMTVYDKTLTTSDGVLVSDGNFKGGDWFLADVVDGRFCHPLADNVVFLGILPVFDGLAPNYEWNSRDKGNAATHHRLPHSLRIVLAVIDEAGAARLPASETAPPIVPAGLFEDASEYEGDIGKLETALTDFKPPLTYRIFTAEIRMDASNSNL